MSKDAKPSRRGLPGPDFFDLAGSDPELLNSGRIPDPAPAHTPLFRWLARILTAVEARLRARGDATVRNALRVGWALLAAVGIFLLVGPVINKPLDFDDVIASAKVDEVDWVARDATVDYTVARDAEGGFATIVEERYTAEFRNGPETAVERVLVTEFQGHDAEFALGEVTVDGEPVTAEVDRRATTTTIRILRPDGTRFEGAHEIAVSYELHHLVTPREDDATGAIVDAWNWPVFGELWPQATKGIEVSLTLPQELDEALVRPPQAYVGWLIASATQWLEPDGETAAGTRYSFTNDQGLPPYPDILIRTSFEAGTFVQPETTALFWWQTFGPLLPLAGLAVLTLFAAAARRVVWADSAGESWYLPRSTPPADLSPELATALLGRSAHAELVETLTERVTPAERTSWLARLARAGRRAGRWGNTPAVLATAARWRRSDEVVAQGLRWVPDSYVRDFFVYAPIAVTLLQWGLLRQLSHQVILLVVWWPAVFVLLATALAIATLVLVRRPRPLTPKGARAVQDLKGIHVFARATRLLDRGPVDEPLLPYAVLFVSPRRAGSRVAEHAIRETGELSLAQGWRGGNFLALPAILALLASGAVLAGAIGVAATVPPPYATPERFSDDASNLPGTLATEIQGFDIRAELTRDDARAARLEVVERFSVVFAEDSARVPQFAREWSTQYLGQDFGFELDSLLVDGTPAPIREIPQPRSAVVTTQLVEALSGVHSVEVRYTLAHPVVDAGTAGEATQQLRWAALLSSWEDEYYVNPSNPYDGSEPVRPLRVELTVAPELADEIREGGWIDTDSDRAKIPFVSGNAVAPWVTEMSSYTDDSQRLELRIGSETREPDGSVVFRFDADAVESRLTDPMAELDDRGAAAEAEDPDAGFAVTPEVNATLGHYELQIGSYTDLGARLSFAPDTFSGVTANGAQRFFADYTRPYALMMWGTGALTAVALGVAAAAALRRRAPGLSLRLVAFVALPLLAIAQCVVFWWVIGSMPGGEARGVGAFVLGGAMSVAIIAECVIVARRSPKFPNGATVGRE